MTEKRYHCFVSEKKGSDEKVDCTLEKGTHLNDLYTKKQKKNNNKKGDINIIRTMKIFGFYISKYQHNKKQTERQSTHINRLKFSGHVR